MRDIVRVAYFPDSFHEINGVAHTSRHFAEYAASKGLPFLCVRAAMPGAAAWSDNALELSRSAASVPLDKGLLFDPLFQRHYARARKALREFAPDIIHITGPSDVGMLGATLAWRMRIPLVAGWHTNLQEYAGRRSAGMMRGLPPGVREGWSRGMERGALLALLRFYRLARVTFAPNEEIVAALERSTRKPSRLMRRGVDTDLFSPVKRKREPGDHAMVLGYTGRLSTEKNVQLLAQIERDLQSRGMRAGEDFRFLIVGQGQELKWLRERLAGAEFAGVLRGEALAEAYAKMDAFVFPSHTDTFGNVVLEALASGVPALVTADGGPKYLVEDGVSGFVLKQDDAFAPAVEALMKDRARLDAMRVRARGGALARSWDAVFDEVYRGYCEALD